MDEETSKWRSRKFLFSVGLVLLSTGLLIYKIILPEVWESVIQSIVFGFLLAQAGTDVFKKR